MKAVLNIVAAVLIAAGLVVAVASLLTPGQVILGIDFKLAATLIVGGLILHALASALALLERMSNDLRQLRKAGSEEPPWLRQSAAALATVAGAAPAAALREDRRAEVANDAFSDPPSAAESQWPEATGDHWPEAAEPWAAKTESDAPVPEVETASSDPWLEREPGPETQIHKDPEPAEDTLADEAVTSEPEAPDVALEDQAEVPVEPAPTSAAVEDRAEVTSGPEPVEAEAEVQAVATSESEPVEAEADDKAEATSEPEPVEAAMGDRAEVPSKLKPSRDATRSPSEATEVAADPPEAPPLQEDAAADHPALYVVEERLFRGKQARVLSDGTIEAETAEGWMRFEDFDHLEEYLDAMAEFGR